MEWVIWECMSVEWVICECRECGVGHMGVWSGSYVSVEWVICECGVGHM